MKSSVGSSFPYVLKTKDCKSRPLAFSVQKSVCALAVILCNREAV